jgi:hypothetical protein
VPAFEEETQKTYIKAPDSRNARASVVKLDPREDFAAKSNLPDNQPVYGPFLVGEAGFAPAAPRPPAREIQCRGVLNARFYWD